MVLLIAMFVENNLNVMDVYSQHYLPSKIHTHAIFNNTITAET